MELIAALFSLINDLWTAFIMMLFGPRVNEPSEFVPDPKNGEHRERVHVDNGHAGGIERIPLKRYLNLSVHANGRDEEDAVSDAFLSQLEQRTEQVKITLANLEADKVRIEGMIAQLQPLVPHYDALVAAERTLRDADVRLDEPRADEPAPASSGWEPSPEPQSEAPSWGG
jgi:hypothetical protein